MSDTVNLLITLSKPSHYHSLLQTESPCSGWTAQRSKTGAQMKTKSVVRVITMTEMVCWLIHTIKLKKWRKPSTLKCRSFYLVRSGTGNKCSVLVITNWYKKFWIAPCHQATIRKTEFPLRVLDALPHTHTLYFIATC